MIPLDWRANSRPAECPLLGFFVGQRHPTGVARRPTTVSAAPRSTSLTAIARPRVGIAEEGNATLQRQPVSRQTDVDVVIAAILRVVYRTLPLVGADLAPALEDLQPDDRSVPKAGILVGFVRLGPALLVVGLADPHNGAAQALLGCCTPHDLHSAFALVRGPQAEDALALCAQVSCRHEQDECACS